MSIAQTVLTPGSPEEAVRLLHEAGPGAAYVAGGTILTPPGRGGEPPVLVDLAAAGLAGVRSEGGGLVVGATTTMLDLVEDPRAQGYAGGLISRTAAMIGTHTVRIRATLGGNIAGWPYPTDCPTTLLALGAELLLLNIDGARTVECGSFYEKGTPCLRAGDLVVAVLFPGQPGDLGGGFWRVGRPRPGQAAVNCAAVARVSSGSLAGVRVATNALADVPERLDAVEALLMGRRPGAGIIREAGVLAAERALAAGVGPERAGALSAAVERALSGALEQALSAARGPGEA